MGGDGMGGEPEERDGWRAGGHTDGRKRRSWRHFSSWSIACCATMSSVPRGGGGKGAEKSRDADINTALYPLRLRCGVSEGQWNRTGFKVLAKLVQVSLCSQVKVTLLFSQATGAT